MPEASQGMGGTGRVGDSKTRREASTSAEGEQSPAEPFLPAVEVVTASEVDPQAICRGYRRDWRPASDREQRQPIEHGGVGLWFGGAKVEMGD